MSSHILNGAINKQLNKQIWSLEEKYFGTCHCEDGDEDTAEGERDTEGECTRGRAEGEGEENKQLNLYTICYN